jgi:hypothetical protein
MMMVVQKVSLMVERLAGRMALKMAANLVCSLAGSRAEHLAGLMVDTRDVLKVVLRAAPMVLCWGDLRALPTVDLLAV